MCKKTCCTVLHFVQLHDALACSIREATSVALRALLHRRTAAYEALMKDIWKVALAHLPDVPAMPSFELDNTDFADGPVVDDCESLHSDSSCSSDEDCI